MLVGLIGIEARGRVFIKAAIKGGESRIIGV